MEEETTETTMFFIATTRAAVRTDIPFTSVAPPYVITVTRETVIASTRAQASQTSIESHVFLKRPALTM
nr:MULTISPECIES: hypothetical protein [unclassified Bifidobacterium]